MNKLIKRALQIVLIIVVVTMAYLIYPKYEFSSSEGIPVFKCNKITGKCDLTNIGEKYRDSLDK